MFSPEIKNCLVVAAHPDDEILGCGGTILRLSKSGCQVYIAIFGEGVASRQNMQEQLMQEEVAHLQKVSRSVAEQMGIKEIFFFGLPDNQFDTVPLLDIVRIVERLIETYHIQMVLTHHGGDLNIDHSVTFRAVLTATRPVQGGSVKKLYTFETPSSTEWAFSKLLTAFKPNIYVDIADTLETKIKMFQLYTGEIRDFPHPRSPEALHSLAARRGSSAGLEAAEAFETIREIIS